MPAPFRPSPAAPPIFLPASNTWILSRYHDVSTALLSPEFCQSESSVDPGDEKAQHATLQAAVQADIDRLSTDAWHSRAQDALAQRIAQFRRRKRIDLVRDIIHPWTTKLLTDLNGRPDHTAHIERISQALFFSSVCVSKRLAAPELVLDAMMREDKFALSKSMFFGLTQTLSSFLAKSWLALLLHPAQSREAFSQPELTTAAIEELLRYAGVVHTLRRTANADVCLGTACIHHGQTVMLEVDSANFDASRFDDPGQLNLSRRAGGHIALGRGLHACVGSFLVRMACRTGIPVFLGADFALDPSREVVWTGDRTLLWPISVPVMPHQR